MYSGKRNFRNNADFATLNIVDDQYSGMGTDYVDPPYALGNSARPFRPADFGADYPAIIDDMGMMNGTSMDHPLAALGGFGLDILGLNVGNLLSSGLTNAETAAKEAAAKLVANTAQDILDKPQVQAAITEQAKTAAITATATQIQAGVAKATTFFKANQTMVIAGAVGVLALGVIYFKFLRK